MLHCTTTPPHPGKLNACASQARVPRLARQLHPVTRLFNRASTMLRHASHFTGVRAHNQLIRRTKRMIHSARRLLLSVGVVVAVATGGLSVPTLAQAQVRSS